VKSTKTKRFPGFGLRFKPGILRLSVARLVLELWLKKSRVFFKKHQRERQPPSPCEVLG